MSSTGSCADLEIVACIGVLYLGATSISSGKQKAPVAGMNSPQLSSMINLTIYDE